MDAKDSTSSSSRFIDSFNSATVAETLCMLERFLCCLGVEVGLSVRTKSVSRSVWEKPSLHLCFMFRATHSFTDFAVYICKKKPSWMSPWSEPSKNQLVLRFSHYYTVHTSSTPFHTGTHKAGIRVCAPEHTHKPNLHMSLSTGDNKNINSYMNKQTKLFAHQLK